METLIIFLAILIILFVAVPFFLLLAPFLGWLADQNTKEKP